MEDKKIVVAGYGAMGKRIAEAIENHPSWQLWGAVDPMNTPQCYGALDELPQPPDLIIDFSHPANLAMICDYARRHKTPCVISTTGFSRPKRICVGSFRPMSRWCARKIPPWASM